ncbi:unnamed protein product [Effrenium voratum]|nr:unnamed protein product [Effrenium voratum]
MSPDLQEQSKVATEDPARPVKEVPGLGVRKGALQVQQIYAAVQLRLPSSYEETLVEPVDPDSIGPEMSASGNEASDSEPESHRSWREAAQRLFGTDDLDDAIMGMAPKESTEKDRSGLIARVLEDSSSSDSTEDSLEATRKALKTSSRLTQQRRTPPSAPGKMSASQLKNAANAGYVASVEPKAEDCADSSRTLKPRGLKAPT